MASYRVEVYQSAAKEFRALPSEVRKRVAAGIDGLRNDPRPRGVAKLKGHQHLYRLRAGAYRIVYEIDDGSRRVRITRIRHRSRVYD